MKLIVKEGSYEADTLWQLIIQVLKHRFWHLKLTVNGWINY